jgi:diphthamide synthase (EF-2-diphthine--ammonia ligase)
MRAIFPLWLTPTDELADRFIARGFRAILTCVDTSQIDERYAGRDFDEQLLAELPSTADPCGENGEFHTFVHAGPIFASPIAVQPAERVLRDARFMYCELK